MTDEPGEPAMAGPEATAPDRRPRARDRKPRPPTPARLERWALLYLERYASTAAKLEAVLMRRVRKHADELGTDVEAVADDVAALIGRLVARGYVDDRAFAKRLASRLRGRGASSARIRAELRKKGVGAGITRELLAEQQHGDADFEAAIRLAQRRRLGPYRLDPEQREERRERDLAALGRAGFSYDVASRIIEADDPDTLEALGRAR